MRKEFIIQGHLRCLFFTMLILCEFNNVRMQCEVWKDWTTWRKTFYVLSSFVADLMVGKILTWSSASLSLALCLWTSAWLLQPPFSYLEPGKDKWLFRELRGALAWQCACQKALGILAPALRAGSEGETAPPLPVLRALELTSVPWQRRFFCPTSKQGRKLTQYCSCLFWEGILCISNFVGAPEVQPCIREGLAI